MSELRFNMEPATIETFASLWWSKTFHLARHAIAELRNGSIEYALRDIGSAKAGVTVLFDVCHPKAHIASKAVERVSDIVMRAIRDASYHEEFDQILLDISTVDHAARFAERMRIATVMREPWMTEQDFDILKRKAESATQHLNKVKGDLGARVLKNLQKRERES